MPNEQGRFSGVGRNVVAMLLALFGTGTALAVAVFIVGTLEGVAPVPNQVGSAAGLALIVAGLIGTGRLVRRLVRVGSPLPSVAASSLLLVLVGMRFSAAAEGVEREGIETPVLLVGGLVHGLLLAAGAGVRPRRPGRAAAAGLAALAVLAAVLQPARPAAAWEAGVRLPAPTATQLRANGVDLAASTHQWLTSQAVVILGNDGRREISEFLASADTSAPEVRDPATGAGLGRPETFRWRLLRGSGDADGVLYPQIRDHLHNFWTHRGRSYIVGGSAAGNADKAFSTAERLWRAGDRAQAVYWLGAAAHLVEDSCVPQHGWFALGAYHHAYEVWVQTHQDQLAVDRGGIYTGQFRATEGHGGDSWSSRNPRGFADECAHRSVDELVDATHSQPSPASTTAPQWRTADHIADSQRLTAGLLDLFFVRVGQP